MGRRYSRAGYLHLVEDLYRARPDLAVSTDLIVGFPGETEKDFHDTLSLMRAVPYASSFSFCYSDRPGTRACAFTDKVPANVAAMRLERLQRVQGELSATRLRAMVGRKAVVLLEGRSPRPAGDEKESWQGRDPWGTIVHVLTRGSAGRSVQARIMAANSHSLLAEEVV
jgi:tRNA-2-methylthio-N6-dimethylallyladenosine synthase